MKKTKATCPQTKIPFSRFALLSITGCTLLSSCVMYKTPPPARSIVYGSYSCDGSRQFVAEFQDEGTQVAFVRDGRTHMLARDASGVYKGNTYSLTGSPDTPITVFEDGVAIFENCVPVTTQPQYYRKDNQFRFFDIHRDTD